MKTLVVFYSRTGTTKRVAEKIAEALSCGIEEIFDTKNRSGAYGYLTAGRDASLKKLTVLKPISKDLADYDLVVIGTPIWAWSVSAPIRTYLENQKEKFPPKADQPMADKKVAFFCTMGGSGDERAFSEMEKIIRVKPVTTLVLTTREVANNQHEEKLKEFIKKVS